MTTQAQIDQMIKIADTITHGNLSELDNLYFRQDLVIASFQQLEEKVERWARNEP